MKYVLIQRTYSIDGDCHIGYGIAHTEDSSLSFEDLTTDLIAITKLVKLCNELDLSPIHLKDVVEDFLVETI